MSSTRFGTGHVLPKGSCGITLPFVGLVKDLLKNFCAHNTGS
jgi:hypothetical protein